MWPFLHSPQCLLLLHVERHSAGRNGKFYFLHKEFQITEEIPIFERKLSTTEFCALIGLEKWAVFWSGNEIMLMIQIVIKKQKLEKFLFFKHLPLCSVLKTMRTYSFFILDEFFSFSRFLGFFFVFMLGSVWKQSGGPSSLWCVSAAHFPLGTTPKVRPIYAQENYRGNRNNPDICKIEFKGII